MTDQENYLQAKVEFLAQQLTASINALCEAHGSVAVWKAKAEAAQARVEELETKPAETPAGHDAA